MNKHFIAGFLLVGTWSFVSFINSPDTDPDIKVEQCHITESGTGHCYINGQAYDVRVDYSHRALGELANARCTGTKSWGWVGEPDTD